MQPYSPPDFHEIGRILKTAGPVQLDVDPVFLYTLVATVQLALRHPEFRGPGSEIARQAAIAFQQKLGELHPTLATTLEEGWHPEFDMTQAEYDAKAFTAQSSTEQSALVAYCRTVRKGSDRAVRDESRELLGYWQTAEWIEGLLALCEQGDRLN